MDEKLKAELEQAERDELDRAWACSIDESEERDKHLSNAFTIQRLLNESKKLDLEQELELKKLEVEWKEENNWTNPKVWIPEVSKFGCELILTLVNAAILRRYVMNINQFEMDNTYTTYAGKAAGRHIDSLTRQFIRRGH